ncbi:MAG TPA: NUDIX domain-containing protein [Anaerolineae bacterium]|jgi:8-oxo-dGTP pyrophosphatase MutT (NUDIX family)
MPRLIDKVFAYITYTDRLLVFSHPDSPEAGIQVPAGTVKQGEPPEEAVMREAIEETGLQTLTLAAYLGQVDHPVPQQDQVHRRRFYHLICRGTPPARWQHYETDPSEGASDRIRFEFFWARLPNGLPELAPGHARLLSKLLKSLNTHERD